MKLYDCGFLILVAIITICVVGGVSSAILWKNDNPIEEVAEEIIEDYTGLDVDLSPTSPEK